jgi:hypothetical protein
MGLLLTIGGWFIDHADQLPRVQAVLSPAYNRASTAYDKLISSRQPLKVGESGFPELAAIVRGQLRGTGTIDLAELRILDNGWSWLSTDKGMESVPTITLQVTLNDGRSAQSVIPDLRLAIKERFLQKRLFAFGATVFWLGILTTAGGIVALVRKPTHSAAPVS